MEIIVDFNTELEELVKRQGILQAMEKSYLDTRKDFEKNIQDFLTKNFGVKPGEQFTILDVISKAKYK